MDNDDKPVGTVLTRRDVLKILGIGSAATLLASCAPNVVETSSPASAAIIPTAIESSPILTNTKTIPACVVKPEMTEGPFFVDEMLNRSDIRSDPTDGTVSQGTLLELTFNVSRFSPDGCTALAGAQVDIWHCDAFGVYSDVQNAVGKRFLRGFQSTDSNGLAKFATIYPGWYPGRAVHIHFKIRFNGYDFTSQLFFDDALTDQVYSQEPYAQRGERITRNENDNIYRQGGSQLVLNVLPATSGHAAVFDIGLQV